MSNESAAQQAYLPSRTTSLVSSFSHSRRGVNFSSSFFCASLESSSSPSVTNVRHWANSHLNPPTFVTELQTGFGYILEWQLPNEEAEQQSWSHGRFHVLMLAQGVYEDLVKRLSEQEHLISPSFKFLNEDATLDLLGGLSRVGHVEYLSLSFPLVLHILGIVSVIPQQAQQAFHLPD